MIIVAAVVLSATIAMCQPYYASTPTPLPVPSEPWPEKKHDTQPSPAHLSGKEGSDSIMKWLEKARSHITRVSRSSAPNGTRQRVAAPPPAGGWN